MIELARTVAEGVLHSSIVIMVGLYFVFSNTIMNVLADSPSGASVMIEINRKIVNPLFMVLFIVSGLAGLYFFFVYSGVKALGGLLFFLGTTVLTVLFNVPLNNALRDAPKERRNQVWQEYLIRWVRWNHVRTICAIVSGFMLVL